MEDLIAIVAFTVTVFLFSLQNLFGIISVGSNQVSVISTCH